MSQWTHVAGVIRVDGLPSLFGLSQADEEREIQQAVESTSIPFGSEGPVEYRIDYHGKLNHVVRGTITIWGDLRDYDDVEEIARWFRELIGKFNAKPTFPFMVRDAVLTIDKEWAKKKLICTWSEKKGVREVKVAR